MLVYPAYLCITYCLFIAAPVTSKEVTGDLC